MNKDKLKIGVALVCFAALLLVGMNLRKSVKEKYTLYSEAKARIESGLGPLEKIGGKSYVGDLFHEFVLEDLDGKIWRLDDLQSTLKIIVIFNLNNCPSCLHEYVMWKKIDESFAKPKVSIIGISNNPDISGLKAFAELRGIRFPLLVDPQNLVSVAMQFRKTPLRITLNSKNEIIDISVPDSARQKQEYYLKNLNIWLKESGSNI